MIDKFKSTFGEPIDGVKIVPQKRILDSRGGIMHMLKSTDEIFKSFGEIYFSFANPGIIKAWHVHKEMYVNNCVVSGTAKLVCCDIRENSKTKGNILEVYLSKENYCTVQIPPGIANGYTPVGTELAMIANCASIPHKQGEMDYIDPFSSLIPYSWEQKHG